MLLIQFIITKTIKGLKHLMRGGRKSWDCSVQGWGGGKRGRKENHINVHQYLMAGCKKVGARLFPVVSREKRQQAEIEIQDCLNVCFSS